MLGCETAVVKAKKQTKKQTKKTPQIMNETYSSLKACVVCPPSIN